MFPDIPVFWSWVELAIKMQAWGAAGTLVLAALWIGCSYAWPLLRWISLGLSAYEAVDRVRNSFGGGDKKDS